MTKPLKNVAKKPYHQLQAEKIIAALEQGTAPFIKPWKPGEIPEPPHNPTTGKPYNGWNRVSLSLEPRSDPRWCTFNQAKAQGWNIRKGAKGVRLQFWVTTERRLVTDPDTKKPVLDDKGKKQYQLVRLDRPKPSAFTVFSLEDMDGVPPLPPPKVIPEAERHAKAEQMLAASEAPIIHDQHDSAFYSSARDEIHLPPSGQFNSPDAYYATALHEQAHSTGHENRLNRQLGNTFGSEDYAKEELRAEIASYMLGQELGIGHDPGQHHTYIASWVKVLKDDPQEIMRASRDAEAIKDYLLERVQEKEQGVQAEPVQQPEAPTATSPHVQNEVVREVIQQADTEAVAGYEPSKTLEALEKMAEEHGLSILLFAGDEAKAHPDYQENTDILIEYHALRSEGDDATSVQRQATGITSHLALGNGKAITTLDGNNINNSVFSGSADHLQSHLSMAIQQYDDHRQKNTQKIDKQKTPVPNIATEKTWLAIPFDEKEQAKAAAGKLPDGTNALGWDKAKKSWYAKPGADLNKLKQYLPENVQARQEPPLDPQVEFAQACKDAGLILEGLPVMDGKKHRVPVVGGKNGKKDGEYRGYLDGHPAGHITNFKEQSSENWKATGQNLSQEEIARVKAEAARKAEQRKLERQQQADAAALKAQQQWQAMKPVNPDHPYLKKKGLVFSPGFTAKQDERNNLVLPIRNRKGEIRCLQHIWAQGNKQFTEGADKQGCFHLIGSRTALKQQSNDEPLLITTGFATAASIHQATGKPVVVAFNDANLKSVAEELKQAFPERTAVILGDDDHHLTQRPRKPLPNSGKEKAEAAATAVNGIAVLPQFKSGPDEKHTDFNDLHQAEGIKPVQHQVELAIQQAKVKLKQAQPAKAQEQQAEAAMER